MKLLIILAAVVAYTCGAPTTELKHPSPVNPDVLVAVKPEEKIILVTDPKEIAKFKRETNQPLYPTVLPKEDELHLTKRDHKTSNQKRDIPVPLVAKHHHSEESSKEKDDKGSENQTAKDRNQTNITTEGTQKPQTLPLILKDKQQQKRDIPVPLVPKHHHPEESSNNNNEKDPFENKKEVSTECHPETQKPVLEQNHTSKVIQKKSHVLSANSKELVQQQKRETSVPLVPKPETSKDKEDKKPQTFNGFESHYKEIIKPTDIQKTQALKIHQHDHHTEGIENESTDVKKSTEEHSSIHVQLKSQPPQRLINNSHEGHKSNIQSDDLSIGDYTASTSQHPLVRQRPVPVAELFARAQDN